MFPIIWPIAAIIYFYNRKDPYVRWISLFLFVGGGGSYFALMHIVIQPHLQANGLLSDLEYTLLSFSVLFFMSLFYFLVPYVFLMSSLSLSNRSRPFLSVFFLLPSVFLFIQSWDSITTGIHVQNLHIWSGLYIFGGCLFYFLSIIKSKSLLERKNCIRLTVMFIPIMVLIYLKDYAFINKVTLSEHSIHFQSNVNWTISSNYIDLWIIILLLFYSLRYGILGIKLKLEKQKLDASMTTLSYGTSIMNHTIKNEIQKIDYMLERTKHHISQEKKEESYHTIEKIEAVTSHLQHMVNRMKEKSENIVLSEQMVDLPQLLDQVFDGLQPIMDRKNITLQKEYAIEGQLLCDPLHLSEVVSNVCHNAVEAIQEDQGRITIILKYLKRQLVIEITDTGCGIEKIEYNKIFEPFFTTKKSTMNYGLGLSYCYNVIRKHHGLIKVMESSPKNGTTIGIFFPKRRFIERKPDFVRREPDGPNQGFTSGG